MKVEQYLRMEWTSLIVGILWLPMLVFFVYLFPEFPRWVRSVGVEIFMPAFVLPMFVCAFVAFYARQKRWMLIRQSHTKE